MLSNEVFFNRPVVIKPNHQSNTAAFESASQQAAQQLGFKPLKSNMSIDEALTFKNPLSALQLLSIKDLEKEYDSVSSWFSGFIYEKINLAAYVSQFRIATSVQILMSACDDIDWIIKAMKEDNAGRPFSTKQLGQLGNFKALKPVVFSKIRALLGINLSDEEMDELFKKSSDKVNNKPNLLTSEIKSDNNMQLVSEGIERSSEHRQPLIKSALIKIGITLKQLLIKIANLLSEAQTNPETRFSKILQAQALLERAEGIAELTTHLTSNPLSYSEDNGSLEEINQLKIIIQKLSSRAQPKATINNNAGKQDITLR